MPKMTGARLFVAMSDLHDARKRAIAMDKPVVVDVVTDMYAIAPHPWAPGGRDFHSYQKTGA